MMFRTAIFALIAACVTARNSPVPVEDFNIPAQSTIGKRLLTSARRVEQNGNNNDEQEADWLAGYSIKYDSCASLIQVRGGENGGGDEEGFLYTQNLVKFILCQGTSGCGSCGSGIASYVVDMGEFIAAYTEMKEEQKEQACEMIAEYCYCDNANDDEVCENQCYADAGMSDCIEYDDGQEEVDINELLECQAMEGADGNDNNNNNGNYNYGSNNGNYNGVDMYRPYYLGPTCSTKDGKSIFISAFYDAGCTSAAGSGIYEAFNYGRSLPYESVPVVALNDCISCLQVDEDANNNNNNNNNYNYNNNNNNNNNNNYNQDLEVAEICQQSYEMAAKCEKNLDLGQYYYTDTTGCDYINNILPNLQRATRKIASGSIGGSAVNGSASTAFAVIFGMTTALLGAYAFFLYRKIHRAKVNLAQAEMGMN